jgi:hypothetical protein
MDRNTDKHIEKLVDKMMKETTLEKPSINFTDRVMSQVEAVAKPSGVVYQPLISKKIWLLIAIGFIALLLFSFFGTQSESKGWFDALNFNMDSVNKFFNVIPKVTFSKTTFYALIMLSVMIFIQIPFLKHHFNQRFEQ